jgi:hypothetical protein
MDDNDVRQRLLNYNAGRASQEVIAAAAEITRLRARVEALEKRDSEAATHVESVIAMRTGFTGDMPYVGWKGLGLALNEALDARDAAEAQVAALTAQLATAREDALQSVLDNIRQWAWPQDGTYPPEEQAIQNTERWTVEFIESQIREMKDTKP